MDVNTITTNEMKILWIVGGVSLFPEANKLLRGENSEIKETGGWITASANLLSKNEGVSLAVAMESYLVNEIKVLQGENILYYILPVKKSGCWLKVKNDFQPEVIHIHGTEIHDTIINYLDECGKKGVVISIQGIRNAIKTYSYGGITTREKINNVTLRDIYRRDLLIAPKNLNYRAARERDVLVKVNNVIGRTISDRSYTWAINPNINYFFCNEMLRNEFYSGQWSYNNCSPHVIFLSQASRPLKGLHILLKALPFVLKKYPDTKIRIAGEIFTKHGTIRERLHISGYGKLINGLIKRYHLEEVVVFVGPQNAEGMKQEYLNANLFLNPSTIENSPNSLCEAQILGVPCLSSYVGGVPDMIPDQECGEMYRFDEIEVLAYKICNLFEDTKVFDNKHMIDVARKRHNADSNVEALKSIYHTISHR